MINGGVNDKMNYVPTNYIKILIMRDANAMLIVPFSINTSKSELLTCDNSGKGKPNSELRWL